MNFQPKNKNEALKVLELFAGSRSFGKAAEKLGFQVYSVDWKKYKNIDLVIDIENLQISDIPFIPNIIWASPDCTTYSVAAFLHHRNGIEPKTEYAAKCDRVNENLINLIKTWIKINPNLIYFIENPRGMLRKMPFMQGLPRQTVWYCQYSFEQAKPTDIWTNCTTWSARSECAPNNPNCQHERSPRSSNSSGTQRIVGKLKRAILPPRLCEEILLSIATNAPQTKQLKPKKKRKFEHFCNRCGNVWLSIFSNPRACANCKQTGWNTPRVYGGKYLNGLAPMAKRFKATGRKAAKEKLQPNLFPEQHDKPTTKALS